MSDSSFDYIYIIITLYSCVLKNLHKILPGKSDLPMYCNLLENECLVTFISFKSYTMDQHKNQFFPLYSKIKEMVITFIRNDHYILPGEFRVRMEVTVCVKLVSPLAMTCCFV